MDWLKARAKERTTWLGVISTAASVAGISLAPELAEEIAGAAVAVIGVILMVLKERSSE